MAFQLGREIGGECIDCEASLLSFSLWILVENVWISKRMYMALWFQKRYVLKSNCFKFWKYSWAYYEASILI
jgi:hypothetical protein